MRVRANNTDANAIDQLASEIEANGAEKDPVESSSDVKSIDLEDTVRQCLSTQLD